MLYQSTRGNDTAVTAAQAIKQGIAPDGGLFVPAAIPGLTLEEISAMAAQSYQDRAIKVITPYLDGFSGEEVARCVRRAYNPDNFDHPAMAPLFHLDQRLSVQELWHGPTYAFKDMALQIMPHLLVTSMAKTDEQGSILILVATSGDTGKAALEGFKDIPRTSIIVFYPETGVSQVQKLQMMTQEGHNVGVFAVKGNFDDAQSGVKKIFGDTAFALQISEMGYQFSSANSINWGRLLPQMIYYFSAYADLLQQKRITPGEKINFVVPTGNFGNILAGFYAKQAGLPINKLICASNANNVLTDFINTGVYDRNRAFQKTVSPSMDILISSNLERLLFELTGRDAAQVRELMQQLQQKGVYQIKPEILGEIKNLFWSDFATDAQTLEAIQQTYTGYNYVIDTHTAVAMHVRHQYLDVTGDSHYTVVLSTASPFKFNAAVAQALLDEAQIAGQTELELLHTLADFCGLTIPPGLSGLNQLPLRHQQVIEQDLMKDAVTDFLKRHTKAK